MRLADFVTLVYHEARNVRHLIRARAVDTEPWKCLVALPVNRDEAWKALQGTRARARTAESVADVLLPFRCRFRVSLAQLDELYANPAWRNEACGGNAWKRISELVQEVAACLEAGRLSAAEEVLETLGRARHNTGRVTEKLSRLDQRLRKEQIIDDV